MSLMEARHQILAALDELGGESPTDGDVVLAVLEALQAARCRFYVVTFYGEEDTSIIDRYLVRSTSAAEARRYAASLDKRLEKAEANVRLLGEHFGEYRAHRLAAGDSRWHK